MKQYSLKRILNMIKFNYILHFFLSALIFPFAIIFKVFLRNYWLVCEEKYEARDNGYHFYKWVRKNRPKQKIIYAINKKSPDYQNVKDLGKVISYGTISHWFWYIVADKNISSQKGGKPNPAVCYFYEVILKLRKKNRVFLQHGVIKDDLPWLYYKNTNIRLFITSAKQEQEYIESKFGYPKGYVKMDGLARFDNLHNIEIEKDLILVMPTWREWLASDLYNTKSMDFSQTTYCKYWNEFLNSKELDALLKKYGKKMIFYPHRNMQKFISFFSTASENITIADWKEYDIQDLLKKSALMITDYSSVFFDFAYMRKPIIFYQFDEAEFRSRQYAQGYFDYKNTILGDWTDNLNDLISVLEKHITSEKDCLKEEEIKTIFPNWDTNNCQRTYDDIKGI